MAGEVVDAFGFDLTPVYARRGEWAERLIEMKQAQEARKRAFDEITIARRAAEEALRALAEHYPDLDRSDLEEQVKGLKARTPVRSTKAMPHAILDEWTALRMACEQAFLKAGNGGKTAVTLITTTDLLVSLVTKAFRRKLRRFVKPNKPRSTYHRN